MHIKMSEEVKKALKTHQKVVALESTIISHGLPYPDNIEVAKTLESIIREEGAIPATIAIINGEIKVGLDEHDLEILAKEDVVKVSKRDFGYVISQKKTWCNYGFRYDTCCCARWYSSVCNWWDWWCTSIWRKHDGHL